MTCPNCNSTNIRKDSTISLIGDAGGIGIQYEKTDTMFYKTATEPILADYCLDCGTIVRFFMKEPKRKWLK